MPKGMRKADERTKASAKVSVRTSRITLRFTPDQYQLIAQRAEQRRVRLATWMRYILLQAATRQTDKGFLRIREPDGGMT